MNRRPASIPVLALTLLSLVSLGATNCSDEMIARLASVLADHEQRIAELERKVGAHGVCENPRCGGPEGIVCGEGTYCELHPGCEQGAWGVCAPIPEGCTLHVDPVCGCDGVSYGNDCERRMAGVPLDFRSTCDDPPVACAGNGDCEGDEYCRKRVGFCDAKPGVCTLRPEACTLEHDPVCGCDGETYSNACAAAGAGVSIASRDACGPAPVPICHVPPGNPGNRHMILVGEAAVPAHLAHGDSEGACED